MPGRLPGVPSPSSGIPRGGTRLALCAPNAFKGTITARAAAAALARGVEDAGWSAIELPVADGGDGTLDVLLAAAGSGARVERVLVTGPLGGRRNARLGWLPGGVAVVEMAETSGIRLLPKGRLDPLRATSRGLGDLIAAALAGGARRLIVGVGGSASTDGGAGALAALGARITDAAGDELGPGGGGLAATSAVDLSGIDPRLRACRIDVAVDVHIPLFGPDGAAAVFAPQKGADAAAVARLDGGLRVFAAVAERAAGLAGLASLPGTGAAGGCGFALALVGGNIVGGAGLVCDQVGIDALLEQAGVVITGEGRIDDQTSRGKAPAEVAARARAAGVRCIGVCGVLDRRGGGDLFDQVIALNDLGDDPRRNVRALLRRAAALAARVTEPGPPQP